MAEQLDQQQTNASGVKQRIYGSIYETQTFLAGLNGQLSSVRLYPFKIGSPANLIVEIQGVSGGKPDGNTLASEEISAGSIGGVGAEITINFSTPAFIESGISYSIVVHQKSDGGTYDNYYQFYGAAGYYANGNYYWSINSGSSWTNTGQTTFDFYFKTYVIVMDHQTGSIGLTSNLKKLISNSYTLISNLTKAILSDYSLMSVLKKVFSGTFSLIAKLVDVERSSLRDYFTWDIMGSVSTGIQVGGTKVFAGPSILKKVIIHCKNTGSSGSTIIDVNKNGTTVFSNPADRPTLIYDDSDKLVISEVDNVKFTIEDKISIDIDQKAPGIKDLTVVAVIEPFTGYPPVIEEISLLDENFPMGIKVGWPSNKTKIKVRFDRSMDSTVTPVFYITDQESQSTPTIIAGSWIATKCPNDTYITGEMDLSGDSYIGKLLLNIKSAKDLYGSVMASYATNIEIEDWEPIRCEKEYTNVASNVFMIDCRTAKEMRFSLDGSTWGSWVSYENTYTVDITSAGLGGSATEETKKVYIQFKDGDVASSGLYYYEIGYYYSSIDFTCLMMNINVYGSDLLNKINQVWFNWYYGDSAKVVPISHTNIYVDGVLEKRIEHKSYIHSGFGVSTDGSDAYLAAGEYYDDAGYYHIIGRFDFDIDTFATLPSSSDRIDLLYIDFATDTILVDNGTEGNTEDTISYKRYLAIYELNTTRKYAKLPERPSDGIDLQYVYLKTDLQTAPSTYFIGIQNDWCARAFERGLTYVTGILDDGEHTIKIEIVDRAERTAYYEYNVSLTASKKANRIKAYPTDADRTAGTNEITSGEIHNYTKLYYKIEGGY